MNKLLIHFSILLLAFAGLLTIAEHINAAYPWLIPDKLSEWLHVAGPYVLWMVISAIFLTILAGHRLADELADLHGRVVRISEKVSEGETALYARLDSISDLGPRITEWQERLGRNESRLQFADNELAMLRGQVAFTNGEYGEALEHFKKASEHFNASPSMKKWLGLCYLRLNRHQPAIKCLREVADASKEGADFALLGNAYQGATMFREAAEAYQEAIQRGCANRDEVATRMGNVLRLVNSPEAETLLTEVFSRNPANIAAAMSLAQLLSKSGRFDPALRVLSESIDANPKAWSVYPMRARIRARRNEPGDWDLALNDLEAASTNNPGNNLNYVTAAEIYLKRAERESDEVKKKGHWLQAEAWSQRGIQSVSRVASGEVTLRLAKARLYLGKIDEAITDVEIAMSSYKGGTHIGQYWLTLWIALAARPSWNRLSKSVKKNVDIRPAEIVFQRLFALVCALAQQDDTNLPENLNMLVGAIKKYSLENTGMSFSPVRDSVFRLIANSLSASVISSSVKLEGGRNELVAQWIRGDISSNELLASVES